MQEKTDWQMEQVVLLPFHPMIVVRDVLKRWYLIVAVALLVGMAAYVVSDITYVPCYTTTTTFIVSAKGSTSTVYQNLSAATDLATVFSEVLNSSILRKTVLESLGMKAFDGTIRADAIAQTNLLTLQVSASDPRTAFLVTQAVIENHPIVSYQVLGDTILEVLQNPKVPTVPSNPLSSVSCMKKASVLAAAAVCALLAALSIQRDTIRSKQEAERKLECPILGEILHERKHKTLRSMIKREKIRILITNPVTSFLFVETVRKLRRRVEQLMPKDGRVIMVSSMLEGEGKSTIAVNLALSLAQKHDRVLLIDCNLRKPACNKLLMYRWNGPGTVDAATGKADLESAITRMQNTGLYLLQERRSLYIPDEIAGSEGMATLIRTVKEHFDYVVLDTPAMAAAPDAECIMELADASVLVVQQNTAAADAVNHAVMTLRHSKSKLLGCVINNVYHASVPQGGSYGYGRYGYGKYSKRSGNHSAVKSEE